MRRFGPVGWEFREIASPRKRQIGVMMTSTEEGGCWRPSSCLNVFFPRTQVSYWELVLEPVCVCVLLGSAVPMATDDTMSLNSNWRMIVLGSLSSATISQPIMLLLFLLTKFLSSFLISYTTRSSRLSLSLLLHTPPISFYPPDTPFLASPLPTHLDYCNHKHVFKTVLQ